MNTLELVEALLYKIPDIRNAFMSLNVMNLERKISASEHPEFRNIIKPFTKPKIISVVGLTQITLLVEPTDSYRVHPTIVINGHRSDILELSKTRMVDMLHRHLKLRDYLPEPFVKKIIYIDQYGSNGLKGVVFSEFGLNRWTVDDPLQLPIVSQQKIGGKDILKEVLSSIFEI